MRTHRRTPPRRPAQQGVVAIVFALSLVVLIGFAGLALDGARLYVNKTELQNAADACALAAAQELAPAPAVLTLPNFTQAHDAGVLAATRNFRDFQSRAVSAADVTVTFASAPNALVWNLTGLALPTDLVARCTVAPAALSLWLMPVLGFATAEVNAVAAASRQVLVNNCAPSTGACNAHASLLQ